MFFLGGAAWGETIVVAAMGDSLTQGYGLSRQKGFVPQMQTWLTDRGEDVRLINAGVSGSTTAGGLSRMDWVLGDEVDAVIIEFGGNDMLRGISPAFARQNLTEMLKIAQSRNLPVLLVGLTVPGNFGVKYQVDFQSIWGDLAREFGVLLHADFFDALSATIAAGTPRAELIQADNLHPSAKGVLIIVNDIGPKVQRLLDQVRLTQ